MSAKLLNQFHNQGIEHAYQPIWKLDSWDLLGYEALLRFTDPSRNNNIEGVLDQVRQDGDLHELDTLSITTAISSFPFERTDFQWLFINIFPSTLLNERFESFIDELLIGYPQAKGKIVFEINETKQEEHIWEIHELKEKILFLKEKGFYIALDDLGKGAAALQKIIEFSPDLIKLDRYFADGLAASKEKQRILSLLVEYSKQRMILILEGIEKEIDLAKAKSLQVPFAQGYLLGRPESMSAHKTLDYFRRSFRTVGFVKSFSVHSKDR